MPRLVILLLCGLMASVAFAQRGEPNQSGEIYTLASALGGGDIRPTPAAGFCIGGAWKPFSRVAFVADYDQHVESDLHANFATFAVGPRRYSEEHYRLSGFVQVLVGARRTGFDGQPPAWNFVVAPGAGADIRLTDKFVWRALAVDLTVSRGGLLRVSSGFVYRFGR